MMFPIDYRDFELMLLARNAKDATVAILCKPAGILYRMWKDSTDFRRSSNKASLYEHQMAAVHEIRWRWDGASTMFFLPATGRETRTTVR